MDYHKFNTDNDEFNNNSLLSRKLDESLSILEKNTDNHLSILINEDIQQHQGLLISDITKFNYFNMLLSFLSILIYPLTLKKSLHHLFNTFNLIEENKYFIISWSYLILLYLVQVSIIIISFFDSTNVTISELIQPLVAFFIIALTLSIIKSSEIYQCDNNKILFSKITTTDGDTIDASMYLNIVKNEGKSTIVYKRVSILIISFILALIYVLLPIIYRLIINESFNIGLTILLSIINFHQALLVFVVIGLGLTIFGRRLDYGYFFLMVTSSYSINNNHNIARFRLDNNENIRSWLALRTILLTDGPRTSIEIIFSSTLLTLLISLLMLFLDLFLLKNSIGVIFIVNFYLALVFTIFVLFILYYSLNINRIFKDTSVLYANKIFLSLNDSYDSNSSSKCKDSLNDIISMITALNSSIRFFGFNINENFVNLVFSLIISGLSTIGSKLIQSIY